MAFLVNIFVQILNLIYSIVGNYGLAIIVVTFLVRLLMLPLTLKQEKSMKKMKALQPKLDELKEKYGNNKELLNQKTVELYQKENVNPASGCLPIIIQLPIFIALYRAFSSAAIPTDASFLWFNLSEADKLFSLGGYSFNLLPILTAIITFAQQKLMSPQSEAKDATSQSMQTMMYTMPIMMLFLFYKMPSGLNLYYFVNSLLSVLQQAYVLNRRD